MLDRDVEVEPLLGEDREDMAAGQHKVGRLVTARDRHPVCVDDGDFSDMAEGPIGRSLKRVEDPRLLRGEGRFVDDLAAPLHVAFVRSPVASGRLRSIDAAASRVTVFTAADIEGSCLPLAVHLTTPGAVSPARPILAIDRVRFVGEMIAAVVAENRYAAADAVELIQPEIDPLPAVVGFEERRCLAARLSCMKSWPEISTSPAGADTATWKLVSGALMSSSRDRSRIPASPPRLSRRGG